MKQLTEFRETTRDLDAPCLLSWAVSTFGSRVTLASSLGAEDQVLVHMIAAAELEIRVFTLDTGRMFDESYALIDRTREELGVSIRPYLPDATAVEEMVAEHGINLFYRSVELRKRCCHVRKVEPLRRALAGKEAWITGLRRTQSVTRAGLRPIEWDEQNALYKINPLADWTEQQVWDYLRTNDVPYNALHDRGFPSIGCAPCTRAVKPGEDPRSGRWWWERPEHRECGLHVKEGSPADESPNAGAGGQRIRIAPLTLPGRADEAEHER
ncbi:MAG: phosphoadenylyl-sulfate reductase [Spirochaetota bacterium]